MRPFLALLSREFRHLFLTPSLYVVGGVVTMLYSLVFYNHIVNTQVAVINPVAELFAMLSVFLVPVITMRTFAGETSSGTIELLMTSPVRPLQIVLSKFLACYAFYLTTLLPCLVYVAVLFRYGDVDRGMFLATLLGLVLIGLTYVSVGMLASVMTDNLIVAAALGIILNGGLLLLAIPVSEHGAGVYELPGILSYWSHYKEVLSRGMIDSRSVLFLLSVPVGFLSMVWLLVRSRGLLARAKGNVSRGWRFVAGLLAVLAPTLALFGGYAVLDAAGRGNWAGLYSLYMDPVDAVEAVRLAAPEDDLGLARWSFPAAAGLLLLSLLALRLSVRVPHGTPDTRDSGMKGRDRWWSRAWPTALAALSILVILVNVNLLGGLTYGDAETPVYRRWDVTSGKVNTLSPNTQHALHELEDTLHITVFLSDRLDYMGVPVQARLRDLLTEMVNFSPRVQTRYVDAIADPDAARRMAETLGLQMSDPIELAKLVVFTYQGRRMVLPAEALCRQPTWEDRAANIHTPQFQGELPLAIMIRRIQDTRVTRVYISSGHGEMDAEKMDRMPDTLGYFTTALRREGMEVQTHSLQRDPVVPFDADVYILASPAHRLAPEAIEALETYARNGGRLLVLLPSLLRRQEPDDPGLLTMLRGWGGRARMDLVVDPKRNIGGQTNVLCLVLPSSPIASGMEQMVALIPGPRSFEIKEEIAYDNGWRQVDYLIQSLESSARFNPRRANPIPEYGQTAVAFTAVRPGDATVQESRVVVVGGADMFSNLYFDEAHNRLFAVSTVQWLSGRHYNVQIRPREYSEYRVRMNRGIERGLFWGLVVGLPEAWLLVALLIWWLRKE